MMGSQNQTGLIPRLCDELFDRISKVSRITSMSTTFDHFSIPSPSHSSSRMIIFFAILRIMLPSAHHPSPPHHAVSKQLTLFPTGTPSSPFPFPLSTFNSHHALARSLIALHITTPNTSTLPAVSFILDHPLSIPVFLLCLFPSSSFSLSSSCLPTMPLTHHPFTLYPSQIP